MSLRRGDHSSRGVLPTVMCRCMWSRNLKNEEAMTPLGSQCHRGRKKLANYIMDISFIVWICLHMTPKWRCCISFFLLVCCMKLKTIGKLQNRIHWNCASVQGNSKWIFGFQMKFIVMNIYPAWIILCCCRTGNTEPPVCTAVDCILSIVSPKTCPCACLKSVWMEWKYSGMYS
jgi:hypothetical protein